MPANPVLPVLFTLLISLFPLAMYCLMLSSINRRSEPLVVRGVWDFAGVMFAASGMVLWAGPAMMATLYERSILGEAGRPFDELVQQWWLLWIGYYTLVVCGALLLLWLRRPTTAIYNVQAERVPALVATTLQQLGYDFAQNAHHQFLIAPEKNKSSGSDELGLSRNAITADLVQVAARPYSAAVEIDQFPALCHATLHWYGVEAPMRGEIEEELRKNLAEACAPDNPAGAWQLVVGILLFGAIFLSLIFFILVNFFPPRR